MAIVKEATELIEAGYEYVCEKGKIKLFKNGNSDLLSEDWESVQLMLKWTGGDLNRVGFKPQG